jgi:hypothetical protein
LNELDFEMTGATLGATIICALVLIRVGRKKASVGLPTRAVALTVTFKVGSAAMTDTRAIPSAFVVTVRVVAEEPFKCPPRTLIETDCPDSPRFVPGIMTVILAVGLELAALPLIDTLSVGVPVMPDTWLINERSSLTAAAVPASNEGYADPHATWL